MEYIRIVDISRHQTAVKQHGKHYQKGKDPAAGKSLLGQAVSKADRQKKAAGRADRGDKKGYAIGFEHHAAVGGKNPLISVGTPLLREERVTVSQNRAVGSQRGNDHQHNRNNGHDRQQNHKNMAEYIKNLIFSRFHSLSLLLLEII